MKLIIDWLINAGALYATERLFAGIQVAGTPELFIAALVIGLVNATIRPILRFLTFPITVLTLGLFYFVLNGLMLYLAAALTPGFEIAGVGTAILGAIVLGLVATVLHLFLGTGDRKGK